MELLNISSHLPSKSENSQAHHTLNINRVLCSQHLASVALLMCIQCLSAQMTTILSRLLNMDHFGEQNVTISNES